MIKTCSRVRKPHLQRGKVHQTGLDKFLKQVQPLRAKDSTRHRTLWMLSSTSNMTVNLPIPLDICAFFHFTAKHSLILCCYSSLTNPLQWDDHSMKHIGDVERADVSLILTLVHWSEMCTQRNTSRAACRCFPYLNISSLFIKTNNV